MPSDSKTLFVDIENSPIVGPVWQRREADIIGQPFKESYMLSFAWRWLGTAKTEVRSLRMYNSYKKDQDDTKELAKELRELYNKAEWIVGHNLAAFDDKVANTMFVTNNILPPKPHRVHDTLKLARKYFKFSSNSLKDLAIRLGLSPKAETGGIKLWIGCMHGDLDSWKKMEAYNKQDIVTLGEVYDKFLPWINLPKLKRIR